MYFNYISQTLLCDLYFLLLCLLYLRCTCPCMQIHSYLIFQKNVLEHQGKYCQKIQGQSFANEQLTHCNMPWCFFAVHQHRSIGFSSQWNLGKYMKM